MLLDEIREKISIKIEEIANDPSVKDENKRFMNTAKKVFNNRDAILQSPKSVVLGTLLYIGYPYSEIRDVYDKLIEELNKVYKMVDPDDLEERLGRHK